MARASPLFGYREVMHAEKKERAALVDSVDRLADDGGPPKKGNRHAWSFGGVR